MENFVVMPVEQLTLKIRESVKEAVQTSLKEYDREKNSDKLYTINRVAKKLKKSHSTIKKYCETGIIRTTKSGLITESAINEYLQNT